MEFKTPRDKLRGAMAAMKAGKVLSDTLGTADRSGDADVDIPKAKNKFGDKGDGNEGGDQDGGGGSEQAYTQSDQPNGGSLGTSTGRTARTGSYLKKKESYYS